LPHVAERRRRILARVRRRGVRVELRQKRGATLRRERLGLLHALDGRLQIQVVVQHRRHEVVQHRIAELVPPRGRIGGIARHVDAPVSGRGRRDGGGQIGVRRRLHRARGERQTRQDFNEKLFHDRVQARRTQCASDEGGALAIGREKITLTMPTRKHSAST
jgi:hypothetical protein